MLINDDDDDDNNESRTFELQIIQLKSHSMHWSKSQ